MYIPVTQGQITKCRHEEAQVFFAQDAYHEVGGLVHLPELVWISFSGGVEEVAEQVDDVAVRVSASELVLVLASHQAPALNESLMYRWIKRPSPPVGGDRVRSRGAGMVFALDRGYESPFLAESLQLAPSPVEVLLDLVDGNVAAVDVDDLRPAGGLQRCTPCSIVR
ncbi:hypothetical protein CONLIGDRAFT_634114 [Coniochaeta ligniaria NRRL 30616]|uniref:Uncharacterized protein n=1 Tax=Coniochaeta ligniaria NRRL 30616 TaxID=1408157 RepID=A0A1J7IJI2_9PEZI|nr:hypothetical protein CONLIGDRAFT_634114 [Coniochaeta ligniaria NRRL 30616]